MKVINFEKKKMIPVTNKESEVYACQEIYHIWKKNFEIKQTHDKK